jgi:hypothetical protein
VHLFTLAIRKSLRKFAKGERSILFLKNWSSLTTKEMIFVSNRFVDCEHKLAAVSSGDSSLLQCGQCAELSPLSASLQLFIQDASGSAAWAANTPWDDFWSMLITLWYYIPSLFAGAIDYLATGIHRLSEWIQQPGALLSDIYAIPSG